MKIRFKKEFKSKLSEKLMDLGNFSIAGLVLGQFIAVDKFSSPIFIGGIIFALGCYFGSFLLSL